MTKKIGIGNQDFEKVRINDIFYIDKTAFIRKSDWEKYRLDAGSLAGG
ncbi:MAG: hypothetical protein K2H37_15035 [Lachnospiraceae bacterium]|nr:hypothetical protein [Lachnospiraceae bacterium]